MNNIRYSGVGLRRALGDDTSLFCHSSARNQPLRASLITKLPLAQFAPVRFDHLSNQLKTPVLSGVFSWWALEDSNLSPPQRQ